MFDHLGCASVTLSYRLLNRTGTLVSYSFAAKLSDASAALPGFLLLLAKLAFWNYLLTPRHASFYTVWAGAGKPDSVKRTRSGPGWAPTSRTSSACSATACSATNIAAPGPCQLQGAMSHTGTAGRRLRRQ